MIEFVPMKQKKLYNQNCDPNNWPKKSYSEHFLKCCKNVNSKFIFRNLANKSLRKCFMEKPTRESYKNLQESTLTISASSQMFEWVLNIHLTAWKVSKYRFFSGPYFPVFGLNTGKCGTEKLSIWTLFTQCLCNDKRVTLPKKINTFQKIFVRVLFSRKSFNNFFWQ